jgi:hypothetical protein
MAEWGEPRTALTLQRSAHLKSATGVGWAIYHNLYVQVRVSHPLHMRDRLANGAVDTPQTVRVYLLLLALPFHK